MKNRTSRRRSSSRTGAAQARPADEVRPAPGDRLGQAAGGRRRLDRAGEHDQADRRDAAGRGAAEIHVRICVPPIEHPCHYGIDMSTREEMIADGRSTTRSPGARLRLARVLSLAGVTKRSTGLGRALRRVLHGRVTAGGERLGPWASTRSIAAGEDLLGGPAGALKTRRLSKSGSTQELPRYG